MVGLRFGVDRFFLFTLCVFCIQLAAEGLAYIVSAFAKDPQQAGAIAPAFMYVLGLWKVQRVVAYRIIFDAHILYRFPCTLHYRIEQRHVHAFWR